MTASLFVKHQVNDYAAWKKGYDGNGPIRNEGGVLADSVHRDPDDPNTVLVYHQFADLSTLQKFMAALTDGPLQPVLDTLFLKEKAQTEALSTQNGLK